MPIDQNGSDSCRIGGLFKSAAPMAVPKKKTSNAKRDQRKATWKRKANLQAQRALSLGKSILTGRAKGFVYPTEEEGEEE